MNEISISKKRYGRFTSSQIWKLIKSGRGEYGFGSPALTYIQEKQIEVRMQSGIQPQTYSKPAIWGNFMEPIVHKKLLERDLGYKISSKATELHPDLELSKFWSGSCDFEYFKGNELIAISETKSYQKKNFALYTDCLMLQDVELFKKNFHQEFWQIVSNAIIHGVDFGEAISFMPYESDYEMINDLAYNYEGPDMHLFRFIYEENMNYLPFIKDGGFYKDLNIFRFEIPEADKDFLTERIEKAIILLTR